MLWSAHCVCTNNAALAKHHQITTRATTQHNMKRNTSFNPQMKRSVSSSYHPVQPWTWLLSTRKHKKRKKKTHEALTSHLRFGSLEIDSLHEQRETAWLNIHLYLFAFRVLVTTFISSDRQDAMLNTSSRLWWHKALTESVHLQLRTKCVSCSKQLVKKEKLLLTAASLYWSHLYQLLTCQVNWQCSIHTNTQSSPSCRAEDLNYTATFSAVAPS